MRPRRTFFCLAGVLIAALLLFLLPWGLRRASGQVPIIELLYSREQVESIQALLDDPESYGVLEEALASSSMWLISSARTSEGFRHSFHFAGRRRNTTRLLGWTFTTVKEGDRFRVSGRIQGFLHLPLDHPAAIRGPAGLAALRAAFDSSEFHVKVIEAMKERDADVHAVSVVKLDPYDRYRLSLTMPSPEGGSSPFVQNWRIEWDPNASRYVVELE